ncbi:MAG: hypothetical protein Q8R82_04790 [Hyphomonadaceae bacterium]|nr:hypothetical protein [Hyphomonadaceae bacterium]
MSRYESFWDRPLDQRFIDDPEWRGGLKLELTGPDPLRSFGVIEDAAGEIEKIARGLSPTSGADGFRETCLLMGGALAGRSASIAAWDKYVVQDERHPYEVFAAEKNNAGVEWWFSDVVGRLLAGGRHGWLSLWFNVRTVLELHQLDSNPNRILSLIELTTRRFHANEDSSTIWTPGLIIGQAAPWIAVNDAVTIAGSSTQAIVAAHTGTDAFVMHARLADIAVNFLLAAIDQGSPVLPSIALLMQSALIGARIPIGSPTSAL